MLLVVVVFLFCLFSFSLDGVRTNEAGTGLPTAVIDIAVLAFVVVRGASVDHAKDTIGSGKDEARTSAGARVLHWEQLR